MQCFNYFIALRLQCKDTPTQCMLYNCKNNIILKMSTCDSKYNLYYNEALKVINLKMYIICHSNLYFYSNMLFEVLSFNQ
jgi:hypothetical protein